MQQVFGTDNRLSIKQLNGKQREAVVSFVEGKDIFVSLPTGFEKSICFQIVPFVLDYTIGRECLS